MTKTEVIEFLQKCSGADLSEVLHDALSSRAEAENKNGIESRLVLCEAYRLSDKSSPYFEGWAFNPIGVAPENVLEDGEPFLQSGHCGNCEVEISAHLKNIICPLCGDHVACT